MTSCDPYLASNPPGLTKLISEKSIFIAGAGGLGTVINAGIVASRPLITFVGAALAALLALAIDYTAGVIEDVLRPRGL